MFRSIKKKYEHFEIMTNPTSILVVFCNCYLFRLEWGPGRLNELGSCIT